MSRGKAKARKPSGRSSRPPAPAREARAERQAKDGPLLSRLSIGVSIGLAVLVVLIVVALGLPRMRRSGSGKGVDVEILDGDDDARIVEKLAAASVIEHPRLFSLYLTLVGGARARPGKHLLADDLSAAEVLHRLRRSGDAATIKVTFPEGFNRFDMAKRLEEKRVCEAKAFLEASISPGLLTELGLGATSEGWLFPATYVLPADADAREVLRTLAQNGKTRIEKLLRENSNAAAALQKQLGWGPGEILTLASIVEKEAAVDDERPIIASVFLNRLREPTATGGRLQADPTAMYGCWAQVPTTKGCAAWIAAGAGKPSAEIQHEGDNRWSTYTNKGLPPTPIANPGEKSILAVLAPAPTRYFYFVAKGGGRHAFSEKLDEHDKNVKGH
jgi:UPF0755 protein